MSDIETTAVTVPESRLEEVYASVVPMQVAQAKLWRDSYIRRRWRERALSLAVVAEAIAIAFLVPNQHYIPEFIYLNQVGVQDTATAFSTLPSDQRVAGIEALIWQYVRHREHYAFSEADEDYAIVSAMSAQNVKDQYQRWSKPEFNKNAPANLLKEHGYIRVYREPGSGFVAHADDYDTGVYQVRFCRLVVQEGRAAQAQRYTVTVSYQLVDTIPLWERVTMNHAGLIVSEYSSPESEGAGPQTVIPGGVDPCAQPLPPR